MGRFSAVANDANGLIAVSSEGEALPFQRTEGGITDLFASPDTKPFSITGSIDLASPPKAIRLKDTHDGLHISMGADLPIPPDCKREIETWIYPTDDRMTRTMGFASKISYYFDGYQTFAMLDACLQKHLGKSFSAYPAIMDWGCGCARVTQHLVRRLDATIYGADIDESAVEWCATAFPSARFLVAGLAPPLNLPDGSLDLIFGVSVFTHLDRPNQDLWLAEISRLLRPGGIALMSVSSEYALYGKFTTPEMYEDYITNGISDGLIGTILDNVLAAEDFSYYRETFHSHDYITYHWGRFLEVVAIEGGAHNGFQDVVVLRKR